MTDYDFQSLKKSELNATVETKLGDASSAKALPRLRKNVWKLTSDLKLIWSSLTHPATHNIDGLSVTTLGIDPVVGTVNFPRDATNPANLVKLDGDTGGFGWGYTVTNTFGITVHTLTSDSAGNNIYAGGWFASGALAKVDSSGNLVWMFNSGQSHPLHVAVDGSGRCLFGGAGPSPHVRYGLLKSDGSGYVWSESSGGNSITGLVISGTWGYISDDTNVGYHRVAMADGTLDWFFNFVRTHGLNEHGSFLYFHGPADDIVKRNKSDGVTVSTWTPVSGAALKSTAIDPAGTYMYAVGINSDATKSVFKIDLSDGSLVADWFSGGVANDVAIDSAGDIVVVGDENRNSDLE